MAAKTLNKTKKYSNEYKSLKSNYHQYYKKNHNEVFSRSAGSILDIARTNDNSNLYYNCSNNEQDLELMKKDFSIVGRDLLIGFGLALLAYLAIESNNSKK